MNLIKEQHTKQKMTTSNYGKNTVSVKNNGKETTYFLEPWIKDRFDNKIKPDLEKNDKDCIIAIDGKEGCQPKGERVLMADGSWKNIEEIKIGDLVISPQRDGSNKFSKVLRTYQWFCDEMYEVRELHKDKKKLYSCSYNHLIPMNVRISPRKNGKRDFKDNYWDIRNYQASYLNSLGKDFKKNTTTLLSFPIENFMGRKNCEIEPYSLGVWLGDGHFTSKEKKIKNNTEETIRRDYKRTLKNGKVLNVRGGVVNYDKKKYLTQKQRALGITTMDEEIINEIKKHYSVMRKAYKEGNLAKTYYFSVKGKFSKLLSRYGLEGMGSGEKFIPKEALLSDIDYRKKLLSGLIDTDGYLSRENSYSICTKSKRLSEDIYSLVRSLGGRGRIRKIKKGIKKLNFVGEYYNVSFYLGGINLEIKTKRKKRDNNFFYLSSNRVSINLKKIKPSEVYGFELDSESSWYITEDYVVTHNSGKSTLGLQWCKYIDPTFNLDRVVFTPEEFREAIYKAKKGQAIMFDEAFTGFSSRAALSGVNKTLISLMMQIRQKNLFIAIVLPTVFLLDKYISIFRTRVLVHVYESGGRRGFFKVYSSKKKRMLILHKDARMYSYGIKTKKRGRFYGVFALGDEKEDKKYRKKKEEALKHSEHNPMNASGIKYREQRDIMIYVLRKELKQSYKKIANLLLDYEFDISYAQVRNICAKFGDSEKEKDLKEEKQEN